MLGISGGEFVVLLFVVAVVLGPERLPRYAAELARLVKVLRRMAVNAREQARVELGPEFDTLDWRRLDPRQYDPRRIVRDALSEDWDPDDPLGMRDVRWGEQFPEVAETVRDWTDLTGRDGRTARPSDEEPPPR
jgi:sec-independent protein translocase protein TatB